VTATTVPVAISRRRPRRRRLPALLAVPAAVAAVVSLLPLWYLVDRAGSQGWGAVVDELWQRRTLDLVGRSVALTVTVTVACTVIGVGAAWLVARTDVPFPRLWRIALGLPLAVPSYVSAFAWVSWQPELAGFRGAALVLVLASYPYSYLAALGALTRVDPQAEEVARSLGQRPGAVALRCTLPQIRPAVAAGALMTSLYVLSDFGAVATMRHEVFTWVIYGAYRAGFNPTRAAVLALPLVLLAAVLTVGEHRARGSSVLHRIGAGAGRAAKPLPLGAWRYPAAAALTAVVGAAIGFPLAMVAYWMAQGVGTAFDPGALVSASWATVQVSGAAALVAAALAIPLGTLAARWQRNPMVRAAEGATWVVHALPGIVLAISFVYLGVRLVPDLYQRTPLLVAAYVVLFLPLGAAAVRTAVLQSPERLEEVARSLGDSPRRALRRITVPVAWPGVLTGAALVFLTSSKELPATLLLHPTGMDTLATAMWQHTTVSDYGAAGPYAVALVVLAAVPTALLSARASRVDHPG
jgi:iron(III) transport system permease protein